MKYYDAKIRLDGKADNEILVENIPAAEVQLLRRIHGAGNIPVVMESTPPLVYDHESGSFQPIERDEEETLDYLRTKYTKTVEVAEEEVSIVSVMFDGRALPQVITGAVPNPNAPPPNTFVKDAPRPRGPGKNAKPDFLKEDDED